MCRQQTFKGAQISSEPEQYKTEPRCLRISFWAFFISSYIFLSHFQEAPKLFLQNSPSLEPRLCKCSLKKEKHICDRVGEHFKAAWTFALLLLSHFPFVSMNSPVVCSISFSKCLLKPDFLPPFFLMSKGSFNHFTITHIITGGLRLNLGSIPQE